MKNKSILLTVLLLFVCALGAATAADITIVYR